MWILDAVVLIVLVAHILRLSRQRDLLQRRIDLLEEENDREHGRTQDGYVMQRTLLDENQRMRKAASEVILFMAENFGEQPNRKKQPENPTTTRPDVRENNE